VMHSRMRGEEFDGIIDTHREHRGDAKATPLHGERFGIEAFPTAHVAQNFDVRQKAHFYRLHALAIAGAAAAPAVLKEKRLAVKPRIRASVVPA